MARYGAKYLQWAQFAATDADTSAEAYPKYQDAMNMGPLVLVTDTVTSSEARNYGDDDLQEFVTEFQELGVDVEVTELPVDVAAALYGAVKDESGNLEFGSEDSSPYGGLAFYTSKISNVNGTQSKYYQGVFYPKVKAARQGNTYSTKGQSIAFANGKAHFVGSSSMNGKYQVMSKNFETEAEAKAWVDGRFAAE